MTIEITSDNGVQHAIGTGFLLIYTSGDKLVRIIEHLDSNTKTQ